MELIMSRAGHSLLFSIDEKKLLGDEQSSVDSQASSAEDSEDEEAPVVDEEEMRAAKLMKARKEEAERNFNAYMSSLDINSLEYEAVRRQNTSRARATRSDGSEDGTRSTGSFCNTMDGRLRLTGVTTSLVDRKNTTYSFNSSTMVCYGCTKNHASRLWRTKGKSDEQEPTPEAIVLADQSFPPIIPSSSDSSCLKIIRR
jgi:hypothetical protein